MSTCIHAHGHMLCMHASTHLWTGGFITRMLTRTDSEGHDTDDAAMYSVQARRKTRHARKHDNYRHTFTHTTQVDADRLGTRKKAILG